MSKTLVFCTSRVDAAHQWETRYRTWLDAIKEFALRYDQILIVDDASPTVPHWTGLSVTREPELPPEDGVALYTFDKHFGRRSVSDFPGWVRGFFFAAQHAERNGSRSHPACRIRCVPNFNPDCPVF